MTIQDRLKELARLKAEREATAKAAKAADAEYKRYEADLHQHMREHRTGSVRLDGIGLFVPKSTTFGHLEDERAFTEWLHETDQCDEFLDEPKTVKGRLNELVRHLLETEVPEDQWPPGLGYYKQDYISLQKG